MFGIGYSCDVKGRIATFTLGYSHPIEFYLPDGIDMKVDKPANNLTPLILTGGDRQLLGQVAANMRALRPPDPYKNKGVRYAGEALRKKVGKTGACGRQRRVTWHSDSKNDHPACAIHTRIRRHVKGTHGAAAAGCVPQREAHLRAGDRRCAGAHGGRGVVERKERRARAAAMSPGAKAIGKLVAERAKDKGIKAVVFDRGGYLYHGRVKALAEAAREAGLEF